MHCSPGKALPPFGAYSLLTRSKRNGSVSGFCRTRNRFVVVSQDCFVVRLWRSEAGDQGDGGACLFRWGAPSVPCVHSRQVVRRAASAVQRTRRNAGRPLPGTCRFRPGGPASPRTPASCGHAFSGCLVHMAEHRGDADERFARVRPASVRRAAQQRMASGFRQRPLGTMRPPPLQA